MADLVFTQDDLDALKEALLTGAEEVQIGDRRIRFRSKAELLDLIKLVQESLEDASDSQINTDVVVGGFRKRPKGC